MPKAPPTSGATTRTRSASSPSTRRQFRTRARCGDWLPSQIVRRSGSLGSVGDQPRAAPEPPGRAEAGAARRWLVPPRCGCPAPACAKSRALEPPLFRPVRWSAGRGFDFDPNGLCASVAAAAVSATTSATGAPTDVTTSIASAAGGRGRISGIKGLTEVGPRLAKSAPVKMAATPGRAAASAVSIRAIRPRASGLRTKAAWRQPAMRMSSVNRPCPVRSARSSTRRRACPTPPADAIGFSDKPDLALRNLTGEIT